MEGWAQIINVSQVEGCWGIYVIVFKSMGESIWGIHVEMLINPQLNGYGCWTLLRKAILPFPISNKA